MTGAWLHMPPTMPVVTFGNTSRRLTFHASPWLVFWTSRPNVPGCPRFIVAGPDLVSTSAGSLAEGATIVTRVGSSALGTVGSGAVPLTLGSSLQAKVVPLARTVAWLATIAPLAMPGL